MKIVDYPNLIHNVDARSPQESDVEHIVERVLDAGVVCLRGQLLGPREIAKLAAMLGEVVTLPDDLAFSSRDPDYHSVVRVTNMRPDGSVDEDNKAAEYWHQDGQFHVPPKNNIWNLLYADVVPSQGGGTDILDATNLSGSFSALKIDELRGVRFSAHPNLIPDFAGSARSMHSVEHPLVITHPVSKKEALYCGNAVASQIIGRSLSESTTFLDGLITEMVEANGFYRHSWAPGDLLIWDNLTTFHRAEGGCGKHPRLLYRAQARMFQ